MPEQPDAVPAVERGQRPPSGRFDGGHRQERDHEDDRPDHRPLLPPDGRGATSAPSVRSAGSSRPSGGRCRSNRCHRPRPVAACRRGRRRRRRTGVRLAGAARRTLHRLVDHPSRRPVLLLGYCVRGRALCQPVRRATRNPRGTQVPEDGLFRVADDDLADRLVPPFDRLGHQGGARGRHGAPDRHAHDGPLHAERGRVSAARTAPTAEARICLKLIFMPEVLRSSPGDGLRRWGCRPPAPSRGRVSTGAQQAPWPGAAPRP